MTVTPQITVSDGRLAVRGRTVLSGVPDNVTAAHASGAGLVDGAFVGATAGEAKSHHVFTFGTLRDCRFMCLFRFKLWWMTQRMGTSGRDVPLETQFILIEVPAAAGNDDGDSEPVYLVMLPLLEGQFRTVLQGNDQDQLQICIESGDKAVQTEQGMNSVYIHAGTNPFDTITQAVKAVEKHMQTFHHREKKKVPSFVDWFGWCTWDAFYTDVTADGVKQGLRSLAEGGAPPRFLIIDDGWQQIGSENKEDPSVAVQEGAQFASRLTGIKENTNGWGGGGGVKPPAAGMEPDESALAYPVQSPGVTGNQPDIVMDSLSVLGLGLVHPRKVYSFYDELHAYLAACGVDGVKVDVQNIVETLGAGHGGRVALTRASHRALEASVARNFPDNGCISCMCHNTDMLYSAKQTAVVRASDDFYPRDPASHTVHISSVAYNTLVLGEFMQPDWDMFHSLHPAAEYHGAARAIGGCPIYVSDKPGNHNFDLLKKLVLPDGSVLRAQLPGRPTRDCLFSDPARDGARCSPSSFKGILPLSDVNETLPDSISVLICDPLLFSLSLLKIWNMNKCAGVVGVFNCQGAGWCRVVKKTRIHDEAPGTLTGSVRAEDVEGITQATGTDDCTGDAVVYTHRAGELVRLPRGATLPVTLKRLEYELFHVCPVRAVAPDISFAPIGLLHMFNAGGAVEECVVRTNEDDKAVVALRVRGCGRFGAYCSRRPAKCSLDSADVEFGYDADTGLVTVDVPVPEEEMYRWTLEIRV
uniref:galactinol--sucrose galactosyltransferase n=1 Tax=Aegilops tauschii TaxID=37682 RepID=M8CEM6_AEGTA